MIIYVIKTFLKSQKSCFLTFFDKNKTVLEFDHFAYDNFVFYQTQ